MKMLWLGAAVLAFAACGSDSPDDPTMPPDQPDDPTNPNPDPPKPDQVELDYADVSALMGASMKTGELASMLDLVMLSEGITPDGFTVTPSATNNVATGMRGGISITYNYNCRDGVDAYQACDNTENHSHFKIDIGGDVSGAGMSMTAIDQGGNLSVRDVSVAKPRVDGPGTMKFAASIGGQNPASYDFSYGVTFDHVRFAEAASLPLSGTMVFSLTVNRTRGSDIRNFAVAATIVFNGSTTATMSLDSTRNYSLDLTTGAVVEI